MWRRLSCLQPGKLSIGQERVNRVLDEGGVNTVTYVLQHGSETQKLEAASIGLAHCVDTRRHAFFCECTSVFAMALCERKGRWAIEDRQTDRERERERERGEKREKSDECT
jgi:hypothetical protein